MKKTTISEVVKELSRRGFGITCTSFLTNGWISDVIVIPRRMIVKVTALKIVRDDNFEIIENEGYIITWRDDKLVEIFRTKQLEESELVDSYKCKDIENTLWQWIKHEA